MNDLIEKDNNRLTFFQKLYSIGFPIILISFFTYLTIFFSYKHQGFDGFGIAPIIPIIWILAIFGIAKSISFLNNKKTPRFFSIFLLVISICSILPFFFISKYIGNHILIERNNKERILLDNQYNFLLQRYSTPHKVLYTSDEGFLVMENGDILEH